MARARHARQTQSRATNGAHGPLAHWRGAAHTMPAARRHTKAALHRRGGATGTGGALTATPATHGTAYRRDREGSTLGRRTKTGRRSSKATVRWASFDARRTAGGQEVDQRSTKQTHSLCIPDKWVRETTQNATASKCCENTKNGGKESRGSTGLRKAARGRMKRVLNTRCKQKRKKNTKTPSF